MKKASGKLGKLILGILSFWPLIFMLLIPAIVMFELSMPATEVITQETVVILALLLITLGLTLGLVVAFILDLLKNKKMEKDNKILWIAALSIFNVISIPVYWYLYFWKEK